MKLPSGREISIDGLVNVAEMLGEESFHLDCMNDAEKEIYDQLRDECFSLSGTEKPFEDEDVEAILHIVKPAAETVSWGLYGVVEKYRPVVKMLIETGVKNAKPDQG